MPHTQLPAPDDLAITLSQRLGDLLSAVEMARLRQRIGEQHTPVAVVVSTAVDIREVMGLGVYARDILLGGVAWALERYGVEFRVGSRVQADLVREVVRIARMAGFQAEEILDRMEGE